MRAPLEHATGDAFEDKPHDEGVANRGTKKVGRTGVERCVAGHNADEVEA